MAAWALEWRAEAMRSHLVSLPWAQLSSGKFRSAADCGQMCVLLMTPSGLKHELVFPHTCFIEDSAHKWNPEVISDVTKSVK